MKPRLRPGESGAFVRAVNRSGEEIGVKADETTLGLTHGSVIGTGR
jgi:hypothetical protein